MGMHDVRDAIFAAIWKNLEQSFELTTDETIAFVLVVVAAIAVLVLLIRWVD